MFIPEGPEALTAAWLTDALRSTNTIGPKRSVTNFETSSIGEGVGFIGRVIRVRLDYDGDEPGAPATLIAKFPATEPTAKGIGVALRFYENEIRVYNDVACDVPLRTPTCYYGDMRLDTNEFILLLEDMAPARLGDQIAGCPANDAAQIVPQMAAFHARFWEQPRVKQLDWMPYYNDPCHHHAQTNYQIAWGPFKDLVGDKLPAPMRDAGERLATNVVHLQNLLSQPPITIIHGDFRLDNLLFPDRGAKDVSVIDWQITSRGRSTFDLGYFLTTSVSPADRRAHEHDLIRSYVDTLAANGVKGYGIDECMRDYRTTVMFCMVYTVIIIGSLDMANERGMALFNAILERNTAAMMDLEAYKVI